jgi:hypothetical protein
VTWQNRIWPVHSLNECDHLLRAERSINVLKLMHEEPRKCALFTKGAAMNEEHQRSGSRQYRESIPPTTFLLGDRCRHVLTSNLDYTDPAVTSQLPKEHWRALVRRGLDPVYIDTSDEMLLFLFVVHLGSDGKMLKAHQHTYSTASRAMNFYIENVNRLPDTSAGRLLMIAEAIRDNRLDALDRMLTKTAVRDLQLEPSIVQVILWPKRPPKRRPKEQARQDAPLRQPGPRTDVPEPHQTVDAAPEPEPPPAAPNPERTIGRVFTDGTPDPVEVSPGCWRTPYGDDPDPPTAAPPGNTDAETDALSLSDAVELILARCERETCESVAAVLRRCRLADCDNDDLCALAEELRGKAVWDWDYGNGLAHTYFQHETAPILFASRHGVLVYRDGALCISTWGQVRELMAPVLAELEENYEHQQRKAQARAILDTKLPPKRKRKAMVDLLDQLIAFDGAVLRIDPDGLRAIEFIRTMRTDDDRFADCKTFEHYLIKAVEITKPPRDLSSNVIVRPT